MMNFIKLTPESCARMGDIRRRRLSQNGTRFRTYWFAPKILSLFIILKKKWASEKA